MVEENNGQNQRDSNFKQGGLGGTKKQSGIFGDESNEIVDFDSEGTNSYESDRIRRRRQVIGGILSQLIEDTSNQLAHSKRQLNFYKNQVHSLEKKLEYLQALEVIEKTTE